jgi:glyoxylase-like metal-dependent hydrolase (beta-lactamase superfamily II)
MTDEIATTRAWREPARFMLGGLRCTVVSDGTVRIGALGDNLYESSVDLPAPYRRDTVVEADVNLLVVESDELRVLIDAGSGQLPETEVLFGDTVGRAPQALRRAGIEPSDIDVVALTHAHSDHAWGLIDRDDQPLFPRARILVGDAELAHWMSPHAPAAELSGPRGLVRSGAQRSLRAYGDKVTAVRAGDQPNPALFVHEFPGHSPGHLVYEIADGDQGLFCWGDVCHHEVVLAEPDLNFVFDFDPAAATASRRRLLAFLSEREADVFACHMPFPGLGRVRAGEDHGYEWRPWPAPVAVEDSGAAS